MSGQAQLTFGDVMNEARGLVDRLRDNDKRASTVAAHAADLNDKISNMKEYREEITDLNNVCTNRSRTAIVQSLQQENRQIRHLRDENRALKDALSDYQRVLDIIMTRSREQSARWLETFELQDGIIKRLNEEKDEALAATQAGAATQATRNSQVQFHELAMKFEECLRLGEESSMRDQFSLAQLRAENKVLRDIFNFTKMNEPQVDKLWRDMQSTVREEIGKATQAISTERLPRIDDKIKLPTSSTTRPLVNGHSGDDEEGAAPCTPSGGATPQGQEKSSATDKTATTSTMKASASNAKSTPPRTSLLMSNGIDKSADSPKTGIGGLKNAFKKMAPAKNDSPAKSPNKDCTQKRTPAKTTAPQKTTGTPTKLAVS